MPARRSSVAGNSARTGSADEAARRRAFVGTRCACVARAALVLAFSSMPAAAAAYVRAFCVPVVCACAYLGLNDVPLVGLLAFLVRLVVCGLGAHRSPRRHVRIAHPWHAHAHAASSVAAHRAHHVLDRRTQAETDASVSGIPRRLRIAAAAVPQIAISEEKWGFTRPPELFVSPRSLRARALRKQGACGSARTSASVSLRAGARPAVRLTSYRCPCMRILSDWNMGVGPASSSPSLSSSHPEARYMAKRSAPRGVKNASRDDRSSQTVSPRDAWFVRSPRGEWHAPM